jgi:hypothetical protein
VPHFVVWSKQTSVRTALLRSVRVKRAPRRSADVESARVMLVSRRFARHRLADLKSQGQLVDLAITQLRSPAGNVVLDRAEHLVGAPSRNRILLVEEVLRVPSCDLITPQHGAAHFLP